MHIELHTVCQFFVCLCGFPRQPTHKRCSSIQLTVVDLLVRLGSCLKNPRKILGVGAIIYKTVATFAKVRHSWSRPNTWLKLEGGTRSFVPCSVAFYDFKVGSMCGRMSVIWRFSVTDNFIL